MKRLLVSMGYGLGGLTLAAGLSLGTFALAGHQIAQPAQLVRPILPSPSASITGQPTGSSTKHPSTPKPAPSSQAAGTGSGTESTPAGQTASKAGGGSNNSPSDRPSGSGSAHSESPSPSPHHHHCGDGNGGSCHGDD